MRADTIRPESRLPNYEPHEDTYICRAFAAGSSVALMAARLGRTVKSVQQRIYILRKDGTIAGYTPRRRALEVDITTGVGVPLTLRMDDVLVRETRKLGGFPKAVITPIGTIWADADGMPWSYGRALAA